MTFIRSFSDHKELQDTELFLNHLLPDITGPFVTGAAAGGDVFPAIRVDRVDFYHRGGKLFSFNKRDGFATHHKYASVIKYDGGSPYISDGAMVAIKSFAEGYKRIKENCALYAGKEARGVAEIFARYSCAKRARVSSLVVLDIEISLLREGQQQDRIDLLLFDTESRELRFFEAKHFSNSEIRAEGQRIPAVLEQLARYESQLNNDHVCQTILTGYQNHADIINKLFGTSLPKPERVNPKPRLLIYGFDAEQREKLRHECKKHCGFEKFTYLIGGIGQVDIDKLFHTGGLA